MNEYLELITLVIDLSLHLKDPVEVIEEAFSIKRYLFTSNDDKQYYGIQLTDKGIAVTYANEEFSIRMENLINVYVK